MRTNEQTGMVDCLSSFVHSLHPIIPAQRGDGKGVIEGGKGGREDRGEFLHIFARFRLASVFALGDLTEMADGGGGWLRLLKFKPSLRQVEAITFSTQTGALRVNGAGFEHAISLLRRYRNAYGGDFEQFGLSPEMADVLLNDLERPGAAQAAYYDALYGAGHRDSRFTMDVDFSAYIDSR